MNNNTALDVLVFSPHPDDGELGCGGLLLKLKDKGYRTGIADMTRAEMSSNGDVETRETETEEASRILKLDIRENLGFEDAGIISDKNSQTKVIGLIRKYRPEMVLIPYYRDRHPDHENTSRLLKDSIFISGLVKFETDKEYHRPSIILNYMLQYEFKPDFIVDISDCYKEKSKAIAAYRSQFYNDAEKRVKTHIASKHFFDVINNRHHYMGLKIRAEFGEPYCIENSIKIDDPIKFFKYLK